jgi:hypothetical protein
VGAEMRTRRSPRNQMILWRALGGLPTPIVPLPAAPACWDCANYPTGGRNRGDCTLIGEMVRGGSVRACFTARRKP